MTTDSTRADDRALPRKHFRNAGFSNNGPALVRSNIDPTGLRDAALHVGAWGRTIRLEWLDGLGAVMHWLFAVTRRYPLL